MSKKNKILKRTYARLANTGCLHMVTLVIVSIFIGGMLEKCHHDNVCLQTKSTNYNKKTINQPKDSVNFVLTQQKTR